MKAPLSATDDHSLVLTKDVIVQGKSTEEKSLLICRVNIRALSPFKIGCIKIMMHELKPHIICLTEVGKKKIGVTGYETIYSKDVANFAGTIMLVRKDLVIAKTESEKNFISALIRPNKFSTICCICVYMSPNERNI